VLKAASPIAVAIAATVLLATPALAAKHQRSCFDFAWESQDLKDCFFKPEYSGVMHVHKMRHKRRHRGMAHMKACTTKICSCSSERDRSSFVRARWARAARGDGVNDERIEMPLVAGARPV
jgi:hypothetical protein